MIQNFVTNNPDIKFNTFVDPTFEKEFYGFVVKKDRKDELLPTLNKGLAAIKADGTYDKIYTQWFKPNEAGATVAASAAK